MLPPQRRPGRGGRAQVPAGERHGDADQVRPGRSRADMAATLAHELAHGVTPATTATMDRAGREVVAESVA